MALSEGFGWSIMEHPSDGLVGVSHNKVIEQKKIMCVHRTWIWGIAMETSE